ncbi:ATP-binding cassette domain-containing protein [Euryarchaeota archaeon]|nr:ATP-binding cassette domain-containing protein [Euryarchaeota archaeon]MDA8805458.1 ATP-binding cassette domain-containing protein [Euryarchaeota archaeon]MDA9156156.1 ATP-binding cassette domain-containing protein [Candidatus Poseidoniaceae archaeon]MDA9183039.1 ATP-binding cassette domain-containing protein [Candidatus Poseidoniaceae archaeon]
MSEEVILSLNGLVIGYDHPLVKPITLDVHAGEIIAILGPSGIGKTTLIRTIAGLVRPLDGNYSLHVQRRGSLGYIPQRLGLVRHATVAHNVSLGARLSVGWSRTMFKDRKERTYEAIRTLGIEEKASEPVRRLSGGQQRRVATARTLAQRPRLMLADEFLGELDQTNVDIVLGAVHELVEDGTAVIMVEHHEDNAMDFATRIWEIQDGNFVDMSVEEWALSQPKGEEE